MDLKQIIDANFSTLLKCLEPTNELLGKLRRNEFVEDRIPFIKQQKTLDDKTDALLTALREVPDHHQTLVMDDVIAALRSSDQEHVANIFIPESEKFPMSDQHRNMINDHMAELCEFIDPGNVLLNKLLSSRVITFVDSDRICKEVQLYDKAKELMITILRKSDDAFPALINSLNETGQSHVVYIFTGEGNSRPLSEGDRKMLIKNREVEQSIIPQCLMAALISKGVFTPYDKGRVEALVTQDGKAGMMLDLIARKSQSAFDDFIEILRCVMCDHKTCCGSVEAYSEFCYGSNFRRPRG